MQYVQNLSQPIITRTIRLERAGPDRGLAIGVVLVEARRHVVAAAGGARQADGELRLRLGFGDRQQFGHSRELARADDDVDVRRPLQNQVLILLGHAAQDADGQLGLALLELLDPAQGAVDLVLGVLPDRAGVVEDRVGLLDVVVSSYPSSRSRATTSSLSSTFIWQPTVSMYSFLLGCEVG